MEAIGTWTLLRLFIGESARKGGRPVSELVVEKARDRGLAGATALRGVAGYGAHSLIHTAKLLDISSHLPVIVEIVDEEDKVRAFLPELRELVDEGMITLEKVEAIALRPRKA